MSDLLPTETPTPPVRNRRPAAAAVARLIRLVAIGAALMAQTYVPPVDLLHDDPYATARRHRSAGRAATKATGATATANGNAYGHDGCVPLAVPPTRRRTA